MKKLIVCIACLSFLGCFSLNAFAATPRSVACGNCHRGSMFTVYRTEKTQLFTPCVHGYQGVDCTEKTYKNEYWQCNSCSSCLLLSEQLIRQEVICLNR